MRSKSVNHTLPGHNNNNNRRLPGHGQELNAEVRVRIPILKQAVADALVVIKGAHGQGLQHAPRLIGATKQEFGLLRVEVWQPRLG